MSFQSIQSSTLATADTVMATMPKDEAKRLLKLYCVLMGLKNAEVKNVLDYLVTGPTCGEELSASDCSALAFCLLMSEQVQDELNAGLCRTTPEGRQRLISAIKNCRKAVFKACSFSDPHWEVISSALSSSPSSLRALDLGETVLSASAVDALCDGLKSPNCELVSLTLWGCGLSESHCVRLASALKSNPSHLTALYSGGNKDLSDSGVKHLCDYLKEPDCRLEQLYLSGCGLTKTGCSFLASALKSNMKHSCLTELHLDNNHLTEPDVKELLELRDDGGSRLKILSW